MEEMNKSITAISNENTTISQYIVELEGLGISIIDGTPKELLYVCIEKLYANYK